MIEHELEMDGNTDCRLGSSRELDRGLTPGQTLAWTMFLFGFVWPCFSTLMHDGCVSSFECFWKSKWNTLE